MKKNIGTFLIYWFCSFYFLLNAQSSISGKIVDAQTFENKKDVQIQLENTVFKTQTLSDGTFILNNIPKGEYTIGISLLSYETKYLSISIDTVALDLEIISLTKKNQDLIDQNYISLSEDDLIESEQGEINSISSLLTSSKDTYLKTVAYEFGTTFFRPRNLGSEYTTVLLNGVPMNKIYNSRPQWSNWGGLNDVLRNQEFSLFLNPNNYVFGGFSGTTNFNTTSDSPKGGKVSFSASNRSYQGRVMATYHTGLLSKGWSFSFSASKRFASEGFREGTVYTANSFFTSINKHINDKHYLNFTGIYAQNIRGKSSPVTQEVYDLKNIKYNSYWGKQNGEIRNARLRNIEEPILQLNHYWNINKKSSLQTHITYQFGKIGNSRLDYGGSKIVTDATNTETIIGSGNNPDPTYYQKLPSYFLRDQNNPDYTNAYLAEQEFVTNGQINWNNLYDSNLNNIENGGNSVYALYEDRNDDSQLSVNSVFTKNINQKLILNASVGYRKLISRNFANMLDLLGGKGFLDVDIYADNIVEAQNDLQNPNRIVTKNDHFKYNYDLNASILNGFIQTQYHSKKFEAFLSLKYANSRYYRNGNYENGKYPENASLGKSKQLNFNSMGIKTGITYKLSGRHLFNMNCVFTTEAPNLQNSFSNIRENNDVVLDLKNQEQFLIDFNYYLRHPKINIKASAYWINLKNKTNISFYFADGLTGINLVETTAFVQEILTDVEIQNTGVEIAVDVPIISGIKAKGVAIIGQSIYNNNPNLYLTSDSFQGPLEYGKTYLKNYFLSGGPQQAYSLGLEYNSPKYWWFGITGNYFKNAYINVAPINRTSNFFKDIDGLPIVNYDEDIAKELLSQEVFKPYYLVNIVGGKSWKLNDYYVGFFINVGNITNSTYKTGGFEQSRNANYNTLLTDKTRTMPLFGPKYWFGYGTTYYSSIYFRF